MNIFRILFIKELRGLLRDKGTFILLMIFPLVIAPLTFGISYLIGNVVKSEAKKEIHLGIIGQENSPELYYLLRNDSQIVLHSAIVQADIEGMIDDALLDAALIIPQGFNESIHAMQDAKISLYFKTSGPKSFPLRHINIVLKGFAEAKAAQRLELLNLDQDLLKVVEIEKKDLASFEERIGNIAGLLLPFLFLFECFVITASVSSELGIGEKERGTLETMLSTPVSKLDILWSKFAITFLAGLWASSLTILTLTLAFIIQPDFIPGKIIAMAEPILKPDIVFQVFLLLIPLAAFFAALLLTISLWVKTIAQASMFNGLIMVMMYPMFISLSILPLKLSLLTSLIPVMNIMLACREITAGTILPLHLMMVIVSSIVIAMFTMFLCSKVMLKEKTIFSNE